MVRRVPLSCTALAVSCCSLKHHRYPSIASALSQKTYFIPLHSEALRVEWDNQEESRSKSSHRKIAKRKLDTARWVGGALSEICIFFWQAFSSKMGLILPFEKKIISMFLFTRTHNWSHFPSKRRNLSYIITNGQEKWVSLLPKMIESSLSWNLSEDFGCFFLVFYLPGSAFLVRFRLAVSSSRWFLADKNSTSGKDTGGKWPKAKSLSVTWEADAVTVTEWPLCSMDP